MRTLVLLSCVLAAGCSGGAATHGGSQTPTPGGTVPVNCSHLVEEGATVLAGAILHADGTRQDVPGCAPSDGGVSGADLSLAPPDLSPRPDLAAPLDLSTPPDLATAADLGGPITSPVDMASSATSPGVGGWTEWTNLVLPSGASFLEVRFVVPPVPTQAGSQTIFLFPSFTGDTNPPIIQPVLQWGSSAAGGGPYWAIASWYLDANANAYYGKLVRVNAGDVIDGKMAGTSCKNAVCASWTITTTDVTQPTLTSTLTTKAGGYAYTQVQGGVIEVYDVSSCGQYPGGPIQFSDLVLKDENGAALTPQWIQGSANLIPSCSYGITTPSSSEIDLAY
jgi:hypothetical protein